MGTTYTMQPVGLSRASIRALLAARKDARRDMQSAMPFIRHWATRAHRTIAMRLHAELQNGARARHG